TLGAALAQRAGIDEHRQARRDRVQTLEEALARDPVAGREVIGRVVGSGGWMRHGQSPEDEQWGATVGPTGKSGRQAGKGGEEAKAGWRAAQPASASVAGSTFAPQISTPMRAPAGGRQAPERSAARAAAPPGSTASRSCRQSQSWVSRIASSPISTDSATCRSAIANLRSPPRVAP